MPWTAPELARWDAGPLADDERAIPEDRLECHRTALLRNCAGLSSEQLTLRAATPSALSQPGLIRHPAKAERLWFQQRVGGEVLPRLYPVSEADIHPADYAALLAKRKVCRAVAAPARRPRTGHGPNRAIAITDPLTSTATCSNSMCMGMMRPP